jgi:hypothetical protein
MSVVKSVEEKVAAMLHAHINNLEWAQKALIGPKA